MDGSWVVTIDPSAPEPPFEQLKSHIADARASGALPARHRLPPVRQLAAELGLAPNTVARAYRELEAEGVIETRGRQGSFITATADGAQKQLAAAARAYVAVVRELGLSEADALHAVSRALDA